MPVMLAKTYAAFRAAGVPEGEASEAAQEIANLDRRLTRIEVFVAIGVALDLVLIGIIVVG